MKLNSIFTNYYQKNNKSILFTILIILLQGLLLLIIPLIINNIYKYGFITKDLKKFCILSFLLLSVYLILLFLDIFTERILTKHMFLNPSKNIRQLLINKYLDLPIDFYYNNGPAAIFRNIAGNLNLALQSFYELVKKFTIIIKTIIYLLFVLTINPLYSFFIIIFNTTLMLLINIIERKKLSILKKQSSEFMKVYDEAYDCLEGEFDIYANNLFKYFLNKIKKSIKNLTMNILSRVDELFVLEVFIKNFLNKIVPVLLLFIIYLFNINNKNITTFFTLYFLFLIFPDLSPLVGLKLEIEKVENRWETINNVFEKKNEDKGFLITSQYDIVIKNLWIKLRNNIILKQINLKIPYAQKLLIVGKSGEGKSVF